MPTGPWTKKELTERLKFVRQGWWNDSILVFMDREVYAATVTTEGDLVHIIGYQRSQDDSRKPVDELTDPREITRVVH